MWKVFQNGPDMMSGLCEKFAGHFSFVPDHTIKLQKRLRIFAGYDVRQTSKICRTLPKFTGQCLDDRRFSTSLHYQNIPFSSDILQEKLENQLTLYVNARETVETIYYGNLKFMNHFRNLNEKNLQDFLNFATSSSVEGDEFGFSECHCTNVLLVSDIDVIELFHLIVDILC